MTRRDHEQRRDEDRGGFGRDRPQHDDGQRQGMSDRGAEGFLPRSHDDDDAGRMRDRNRDRDDRGQRSDSGYGDVHARSESGYGGRAPGSRGFGPGGYAPRENEQQFLASFDERSQGERYGQRYGSDSEYGSYGASPPRGQASHRGRGPRGYVRSDVRIVEDINERMTDDDTLDASEIEVSVSNGVATLTGTVGERWMKHRAEDIADQCGGVSDVVNHIKVQRSGHGFLGSPGGSSETG